MKPAALSRLIPRVVVAVLTPRPSREAVPVRGSPSSLLPARMRSAGRLSSHSRGQVEDIGSDGTRYGCRRQKLTDPDRTICESGQVAGALGISCRRPQHQLLRHVEPTPASVPRNQECVPTQFPSVSIAVVLESPIEARWSVQFIANAVGEPTRRLESPAAPDPPERVCGEGGVSDKRQTRPCDGSRNVRQPHCSDKRRYASPLGQRRRPWNTPEHSNKIAFYI